MTEEQGWPKGPENVLTADQIMSDEEAASIVARDAYKAPPTEGHPVNHPPHYNQHPSKIECIEVCEHMNFCLGNAIKYIWRADLKEDPIVDLEKAIWYLQREISRRKKGNDD